MDRPAKKLTHHIKAAGSPFFKQTDTQLNNGISLWYFLQVRVSNLRSVVLGDLDRAKGIRKLDSAHLLVNGNESGIWKTFDKIITFLEYSEKQRNTSKERFGRQSNERTRQSSENK